MPDLRRPEQEHMTVPRQLDLLGGRVGALLLFIPGQREGSSLA